jgi:hypothetical protein
MELFISITRRISIRFLIGSLHKTLHFTTVRWENLFFFLSVNLKFNLIFSSKISYFSSNSSTSCSKHLSIRLMFKQIRAKVIYISYAVCIQNYS